MIRASCYRNESTIGQFSTTMADALKVGWVCLFVGIFGCVLFDHFHKSLWITFNYGTLADYRKHRTVENGQSGLMIMITRQSARFPATIGG